MKLKLDQSINLRNKPFGQRVVVYDFVGRYGDWLFKQPLLFSLQEIGYFVYASSKNHFSPLRGHSVDPKKEKCDFALVFTRSDLKLLTSSFLKTHRYTLEIRRQNRFTESVILWNEDRRALSKSFRKTYEQERIYSIAKFLAIPYIERTIAPKPPQNKQVAVSFNVSENEAQRLRLSIDEIIRVIQYFHHNHYTIFYIKRKSGQDSILRRLPRSLVLNFRIVETKTMAAALKTINGTTYYFGADSGLAHYAIQNGSIAFTLFNKQYHGPTPLFNSNFFNHFVFFGDTKFSKEVIHYLDELQTPNEFYGVAYQYIKKFIADGKLLLQNAYRNKEKLKWLKLYFALHSTPCRKQLSRLENLMNGVFFSDNLYEFDYHELLQKKKKIFTDSKEFTEFLERAIEKCLGASRKKVSIFAKNCSFFHGTCLKRNVSDIDGLLVSAPSLSEKHQKDVLRVVCSALERYAFSTQLPHQTPILGSIKDEKQRYYPILVKGQAAFSFKIHGDIKDVEKYQTRIKVKIILGELPHKDLLFLRKKVTAEQVFWGKHFLKEIDALLKERKFFEQYGAFIRKIETLFSQVGGFGVNANVVLAVNKRDADSLSFVLERLMRHGIIYISKHRLFVNWDLRRPQHRWFIPVSLVWHGKVSLDQIVAKALSGKIYTYAPFKILKDLSHNKIVPQKMVDLLSSETYLVILEIFNAPRRVRRQMRRYSHFSKKEIQDYAQIPNSNCNDKEDRKICLFGLLTGFSPRLLPSQVKLLSRYNLFVQYLNRHSETPIYETKFFSHNSSQKINSPRNFAKEFKENFTQILREYYLYQNCHLPLFLLQEKRRELLFMYFVLGRGLMEGPSDQSQEVQKFLSSVSPDSFFGDITSSQLNVQRINHTIPSPSENYILLRILQKLRLRKPSNAE